MRDQPSFVDVITICLAVWGLLSLIWQLSGGRCS